MSPPEVHDDPAPEVRIDQLTGLRTILAPARAERPIEFVNEREGRRQGECPFDEGNEDKTPPEVWADRPQAASWRVGGIVSIGFVLTAIALHLVGIALVRLVRPLGRVQWFPLRHAVNGLGRPGHQTRVILLAVGLGVFFILGVRLLQMNLTREFSVALSPDAPDMFLIDVQQDQSETMRQVLAAVKSDASPRLLPVLRARITGVQGKELNLASVESVRERGNIGREFTVTYRDHLQPNERLVEGAFWGRQGTIAQGEVSIERAMRERARRERHLVIHHRRRADVPVHHLGRLGHTRGRFGLRHELG